MARRQSNEKSYRELSRTLGQEVKALKSLHKNLEKARRDLLGKHEELEAFKEETEAANQLLNEKKADLESLIRAIHDSIMVMDPHLNIIQINSSALQFLGARGSRDVLGRKCYDAYHGRKKPCLNCPCLRVLKTKKPVYVEKYSQGIARHLSVWASPIFDEKRNVVKILEISRDITEHKRAEAQIRRRAAQTALLYEVGRRVSGKLEPAAVLAEIVTAIRDAFNYYGVMLMLLDEETGRLKLGAIKGGYAKIFPPDLTVRLEKGMLGRAAATGKIQVSNDVSKNPYFVKLANEVTKSELDVPIRRGKKTIGVLNIQSVKWNAFADSDIEAMQALSTQIAAAIENARLYERAQQEIGQRQRAERELQAEKAYLDQLFDNAQEAIVIVNDKHRVMRVNDEFTRMFGFTRQEAAGQLIDQLISLGSEEIGKEAGELTEKLDKGEKVAFESVRRKKDRSPIHVSATGAPIRVGGKQVGHYAIYRDITKRRRAEEELARERNLLRTLIDNVPDYIFIKDTESRFVINNAAHLHALGVETQDDVIGQTDFDIFPRKLAEQYHADEQEIIRSGQASGQREEPVIDQTTGEKKWLSTIKVPLFDGSGKIVGLVGISRDITEPKRAEEALREAKDEAEKTSRELTETNRQLEKAIKRANQMAVQGEVASRAKSQFLANMSHEVRTPLNGILGMTELALGSELTSVQREYLNAIRASGESLMSVINDILDFSKIEAKKIELEEIPFDLRDSIGDMVSAVALEAHKKGLELAFHVDPQVEDKVIGDPVRLRQVILNLVSNAIKFTQKGEVIVRVREEEKTDDDTLLSFKVTDTGIGIPTAKQKKIFEAFTQADSSTTRTFGGSGLGLTISAGLIRLMGGAIEVTSRVGKGSTFRFSVRLRLQKGPKELHVPRTLPPGLIGLPVLAVDDNETNRAILQEMLLDWKMKPTVVADGKTAMEMMINAKDRGVPYSLVIIDYCMPGMGGFELAEKIKSSPNIARATIMMLTSGGMQGDAARCQQLGISSYLIKPVKHSDLLDAILLALKTPSRGEEETSLVIKPLLQEAGQRLNILLAEDNIVNQKVATYILEKHGHRVTVASDGVKALREWKSKTFDLLLIDIQMPKLDGFEVLKRIREKERREGVHTPIIAMTAHAMKGDREICLQAGMDDYISKPLKSEELIKTIDQTMARMGTAAHP